MYVVLINISNEFRQSWHGFVNIPYTNERKSQDESFFPIRLPVNRKMFLESVSFVPGNIRIYSEFVQIALINPM